MLPPGLAAGEIPGERVGPWPSAAGPVNLNIHHDFVPRIMIYN